MTHGQMVWGGRRGQSFQLYNTGFAWKVFQFLSSTWRLVFFVVASVLACWGPREGMHGWTSTDITERIAKSRKMKPLSTVGDGRCHYPLVHFFQTYFLVFFLHF